VTITEELAALLAELGLGDYRADGSAGGDVFLAALPQSPDEAVAVARYPAGESDSRLGYDEVNAQYRCRAPNTSVAEDRAQNIYDALHGLGNRVLPGGTVLQLAVGIQSGPIYIGRDSNGRHEWTVNVRMELRRPTVHRT
jgi:hypothetical protein